MVRFRISSTVVVGLLLMGALGCGASHYQPSGKITKGGAPLTISEKGVLEIALYAESDKDFGSPEAVTWEKDGSFKVKGRLGTGVPAGKYRVSVALKDPYTPNAKDVFEGKFAKANAQVFEVKDSSTLLEVDVDKK